MFIKPKAEAVTQINALLGAALAAKLEPFIDAAADAALVPDIEGRWPGADNYEPTVDVAYAMAWLFDQASADPTLNVQTVTAFSSEGSSFTLDKSATFGTAAALWRSRSWICQQAPQLGVISIERPVNYVPRSEAFPHV